MAHVFAKMAGPALTALLILMNAMEQTSNVLDIHFVKIWREHINVFVIMVIFSVKYLRNVSVRKIY